MHTDTHATKNLIVLIHRLGQAPEMDQNQEQNGRTTGWWCHDNTTYKLVDWLLVLASVLLLWFLVAGNNDDDGGGEEKQKGKLQMGNYTRHDCSKYIFMSSMSFIISDGP